MRMQDEDDAVEQLVGAVNDAADGAVSVLNRGRELATWNGQRIAAYWLGGTRCWKTSVSVPRLMPLNKVSTMTSSGPGAGRGTARILPCDRSSIQNAQEWSCRRDTLVPFVRRALGTGRVIPNLREIMSRNWWCRL